MPNRYMPGEYMVPEDGAWSRNDDDMTQGLPLSMSEELAVSDPIDKGQGMTTPMEELLYTPTMKEGEVLPVEDTIVYLVAINPVASGIHVVRTVTESDDYEPGMGTTTRTRLIPVHNVHGKVMEIGGYRHG